MSVRRVIVTLWLLVAALFIASGCKGPEEHLKAFYKKGGKIEPKIVQVEVERFIIKDGDTISITDTLDVPCPDAEVNFPTPKYEARFDYKKYRDSLDHIKKMSKLEIDKAKDEYDYAIKLKDKEIKRLKTQLDAEVKISKSSVFWTWVGKRWWIWCIITFFLGMYTIYRIRKIKNILKDVG